MRHYEEVLDLWMSSLKMWMLLMIQVSMSNLSL